jgi:DNA-binding response OmpR family regulator
MLDDLDYRNFTPLEWSILQAIAGASAVGSVIHQREILQTVYPDRTELPAKGLVATKLCRIRKKLEKTPIEIRNRWGRGFYLVRRGDQTAAA